MIAAIAGILAARDEDRITLQTDGGVGYEVTVPLAVFERLPPLGGRVQLHTELVVREDGWALYGFDQATDRRIFQRLLGASGFGPRLALALLSTLGPERTVRSIMGKDIAALATVSRPAEEAVRALAALGYAPAAAEEAIRQVAVPGEDGDTAQLVRRALQWIAKPRGGR
jgi:Holliday junction DNA helicase RuvA